MWQYLDKHVWKFNLYLSLFWKQTSLMTPMRYQCNIIHWCFLSVFVLFKSSKSFAIFFSPNNGNNFSREKSTKINGKKTFIFLVGVERKNEEKVERKTWLKNLFNFSSKKISIKQTKRIFLQLLLSVKCVNYFWEKSETHCNKAFLYILIIHLFIYAACCLLLLCLHYIYCSFFFASTFCMIFYSITLLLILRNFAKAWMHKWNESNIKFICK